MLAAAEGLKNTEIAARQGIERGTAAQWRSRFAGQRLEGLLDEPRPGRPRTVTDAQVEEVIVRTLESTPKDATHWSTRSLAAELGLSQSAVARLLGVTEGTVRYHRKRGTVGAVDGRSKQDLKAAAHAEAIAHWRDQQEEGRVNLAALHDWLRREHGYDGSLKSVQRFWKRTFPSPAIRAMARGTPAPGCPGPAAPGDDGA